MNFGLREWMILIGGLLIIAVIVDGLRRMLADRRNMIRMGMSYQGEEGDDFAENDDHNPELPNGGARPKEHRAGDVSEPSIGSLDIAPEEVAIAPSESPPLGAEEGIAPRQKFTLPKVNMAKLTKLRNGKSVFSWPDKKSRPEGPAVDGFDVSAIGQDLSELAAVEDAIESSAVSQAEKSAAQALPDEVLVINVVSRDNNGFNGADLLEVLLACDVRYGEMGIFHRHEGAQGQGNVQFSVANLVKPGTFDLASIKTFYTPGISLFMQLPGPEQPSVAFDCMAETAACLVNNLQGEMRDERHSILTQQTLEHYRQRIVEYERKRLARVHRQA